MPVSAAVRRYYAERILAGMSRQSVPRNFTPLDGPADGRSAVEGCRGGGKNIAEFEVRCADGRVLDLRVACGLCNPAMYAAADIVIDWARGRETGAVLAPDPLDPAALGPFFSALGGEGHPEDAREKFQYALVGVQNAIRDAGGEPALDLPDIPEPRAGDPSEG